MTRRPIPLLLLAALFVVGACSDDGGGDGDDVDSAAPATTGLTTRDGRGFDECADEMVAAVEDIDSSGVDMTNGLSEEELLLLFDQVETLTETVPVLQPEDPCMELLRNTNPAKREEMLVRMDPVVAELLFRQGAIGVTESTTTTAGG